MASSLGAPDGPSLHWTIRHRDQRHGKKAGAQSAASDPKWKIVQLGIAAKAEENLTMARPRPRPSLDFWYF